MQCGSFFTVVHNETSSNIFLQYNAQPYFLENKYKHTTKIPSAHVLTGALRVNVSTAGVNLRELPEVP